MNKLILFLNRGLGLLLMVLCLCKGTFALSELDEEQPFSRAANLAVENAAAILENYTITLAIDKKKKHIFTASLQSGVDNREKQEKLHELLNFLARTQKGQILSDQKLYLYTIDDLNTLFGHWDDLISAKKGGKEEPILFPKRYVLYKVILEKLEKEGDISDSNNHMIKAFFHGIKSSITRPFYALRGEKPPLSSLLAKWKLMKDLKETITNWEAMALANKKDLVNNSSDPKFNEFIKPQPVENTYLSHKKSVTKKEKWKNIGAPFLGILFAVLIVGGWVSDLLNKKRQQQALTEEEYLG